MTKPTIECRKNGPLLVRGLEHLQRIGADAPLAVEAVCALCRCGQSANKPFCDGTHKQIDFVDEPAEDRTPDRRKNYVGREITIHDNRGICAHAALCTDRLASVFRYGQKPWIDPDGAAADAIIEVVRACPSGALSYSIDGVEHRDPTDRTPRVLIAPKGPYAIQGDVELKGVDFGEGASRQRYDLCRCGQSKNKPFCDGSHWNTDFDEQARDV